MLTVSRLGHVSKCTKFVIAGDHAGRGDDVAEEVGMSDASFSLGELQVVPAESVEEGHHVPDGEIGSSSKQTDTPARGLDHARPCW